MSTTSNPANPGTVEYRDVAGFPGYKVGSDGSVWSLRVMGANDPKRVASQWKRLRVQRRREGCRYCMIHLRPTPGGKQCHIYLHQLVLKTFIGPCPKGMVACHNNGDAADNRVANLRWDTQKNNLADMIAHGTHRRGESIVNHKLTERDVRTIRHLAELGLTQNTIAALFGIAQTTVGRIVDGRSWAHVQDLPVEILCVEASEWDPVI